MDLEGRELFLFLFSPLFFLKSFMWKRKRLIKFFC